MIILQEMEEKDSVQIAELEKEIFKDAWTQIGIEETWREPHSFIIVAKEEGEVVGYCIVYCVLDEAEIAKIAVQQTKRHEGVGSRLLEETERICLERNIARILLEVRESNVTARKFYTKQKFVADGIRKNFYENPMENAILMSKKISMQ